MMARHPIADQVFSRDTVGATKFGGFVLSVMSLVSIEEHGSSAIFAQNLYPAPRARDGEAAAWVLRQRLEHRRYGTKLGVTGFYVPWFVLDDYLGKKGPIMRAVAYEVPEDVRAYRYDLKAESRPAPWFYEAKPSLMMAEQYLVDLQNGEWSCSVGARDLTYTPAKHTWRKK